MRCKYCNRHCVITDVCDICKIATGFLDNGIKRLMQNEVGRELVAKKCRQHLEVATARKWCMTAIKPPAQYEPEPDE